MGQGIENSTGPNDQVGTNQEINDQVGQKLLEELQNIERLPGNDVADLKTASDTLHQQGILPDITITNVRDDANNPNDTVVTHDDGTSTPDAQVEIKDGTGHEYGAKIENGKLTYTRVDQPHQPKVSIDLATGAEQIQYTNDQGVQVTETRPEGPGKGNITSEYSVTNPQGETVQVTDVLDANRKPLSTTQEVDGNSIKTNWDQATGQPKDVTITRDGEEPRTYQGADDNRGYQIPQGDNLWNVAQDSLLMRGQAPIAGEMSDEQIQQEVERIAAYNGISDPNLIQADASLKMPPPDWQAQ